MGRRSRMRRPGRERRRRSSRSAPTAPSRVRSGCQRRTSARSPRRERSPSCSTRRDTLHHRRHRDTRPRPVERRDATRGSGGRVRLRAGRLTARTWRSFTARRPHSTSSNIRSATCSAKRQDPCVGEGVTGRRPGCRGGVRLSGLEVRHPRLRLEGRPTHAGEWAWRDLRTCVVAAR